MKYPRLVVEPPLELAQEVRRISRERLFDRELPLMSLGALDTRSHKEFAGIGFYLSSGYDWVIGEDSGGVLVLLPLKKE